MRKRTDEGTFVLRLEDEEEPTLGGAGFGECFPGKELYIGFEVWFKADFQYGRSD